MRKRWIVFGLAALLVFSGCGAQLPDMTEEEAKAIGEYAAITLLKYDANSRSRLVDLSQITEPDIPEISEEVEPEPPEPEEPEASETPVIEIEEGTAEAESMESFLGLPDYLTVTYLNAELCQSYPPDGSEFFSLEASGGKELLVLNFQINNSSDTQQLVDLLHRQDVYRITVNEEYTRTALTTMLMNDMSTYLGMVEAESSATVVLLIEVDMEQAGNISSIVLNMKNESSTYTMQVL